MCQRWTMLILVLTGCGAWLIGSEHAVAQVQQTVQLPEFHFFGVNTSVLAPDRGSVSLGGGRTARDGERVGSYSRHHGARGASVHVWRHELAELDARARVVTEPAPREVVPEAVQRRAAFLKSHLGRRR